MRTLVAVIAVWFCGFIPSLARADNFFVQDSLVELDLRKDGTLYVTEHFNVAVRAPIHGIFRRIPTHYDDGRGNIRSIELGGISVTREDGTPHKTKVTREGSWLKIRIGDPDVYLSPDTNMDYVVRYQCQNVVNWFEDGKEWQPYAELYWNALGHDWEEQFQGMRVRIKHPLVNDPKGTRVKVFVGYEGSRDNDAFFDSGRTVGPNLGISCDKTATGFDLNIPRQMGSHVGATIVLALPADSIDKPSQLQVLWWQLKANLGYTIPLFIGGALFLIWTRIGRDPKIKAMEAAFEPPEGMSAAECGVLIDGNVDNRDISAALVSLAVKGHLTFHEAISGRPRDATVKLTGKEDKSKLTTLESKLLGYLEGAGSELDRSDLQTFVGPHVSDMKSALYNDLKRQGYYRISPSDATGSTCCLGVIVTGALAFLMYKFANDPGGLSFVIGGGISLILVAIFAQLMPSRTYRGARAWSQVAGLANAMKGRKNYLEWVADRQTAGMKFEELLPFAIAFGLVKQWSDTFKEVVTDSPSWYHGQPGHTFGTNYGLISWSNSLSDTTSSLGTAATTPPRTASSSGGSGWSGGGGGGGGFSGGGFGGGGGGSW